MNEKNPIHSSSDLQKYYQNLNCEGNLYVGMELERSGVYQDSLDVVPHNGEAGYKMMFKKLVEEVGWEILEEGPDTVYEIQRGETRVTIEPDGRPELSGSPMENLHDLSREFRLHDNELLEIGNVFNIGWLPLGVEPLHSNDDINMVAKQRYDVYMNTFPGEWMNTYLKRINGLTANLSVTDEENAVHKAQTLFRILPIVGAMFASSPFINGKRGSYLCERRHAIHTNMQERTNGVPRTILTDGFSYEEWIEHYLNIPLIVLKEDGDDVAPDRPMKAKEWLEGECRGRNMTPFDFDQHIKTVWADIRLRPGYLEFRTPDSVPYSLAMGFVALLKGLVFDSNSWAAVAELTKGWTYDDIIEADQKAWKTGLQTEVHGHKLLTYAQELITLANEKLHSFERTDAQEDDESVYLAPLKEQIFIMEKSPAEELVGLYEGEWNQDLSRIVDWCKTK